MYTYGEDLSERLFFFFCSTQSQGWDRQIDEYTPCLSLQKFSILFYFQCNAIHIWLIYTRISVLTFHNFRNHVLFPDLVIQSDKLSTELPRTGRCLQGKWQSQCSDTSWDLHFIFGCWAIHLFSYQVNHIIEKRVFHLYFIQHFCVCCTKKGSVDI